MLGNQGRSEGEGLPTHGRRGKAMSGYEGKGKEAFSGEIVRQQKESERSLEKYCSVNICE